MKAMILMALAAVAAFAETKLTWNVIDVEKLRAMGVPGITPATFDGVFVYAEQGAPVSGFLVQVTFADGAVVAHYAPVAANAPCACSAVTVPFPRGAAIAAPKSIRVYPVYVAAAAEAKEAIE